MPAVSFTPVPSFDWTFTPVPSYDWTEPSRPAPTPTPPPLLPPLPPLRKRNHRDPLPRGCRTVLIDRFEAAIQSGLIDLCDEDMECTSLDFTLQEVAMLLAILIPEEYAGPRRKAAKPSRSAPASRERIAEYAQRVVEKRQLFDPRDAGPVFRGQQLVERERANGSGRQVVGWAAAADA